MMKKIERILAIIVLLLDHEIVSTAQLAERFDVTKRTIFRDIETIESAGFPIVSHPGRKGGFSLISSFKLRTYTYSSEEKQAMINALDITEGLFGTLDRQSLLKEKISLMQNENKSFKQAKTSFSFDSPSLHRPEIEAETKEKMNQINRALKKRQQLIIEYVDNKGERTKRTIHPYEMMLMNGSWYLYSYCEVRKAFRYFKVTRIREILIQAETFELLDYSNEKQVEENGDLIRLRFKKEILGRLYDYYTESEIQVADTHVDVTIYANQQATILPFLLMFGDGVKVISPVELKERHKQEIFKLTQTY